MNDFCLFNYALNNILIAINRIVQQLLIKQIRLE